MKRLLVILSIATLWLNTQAQDGAVGVVNVAIEGTSANAAGKRIELVVYADMLSMTEQLADADTVSADGTFTLHCYANYPRLVVLQVENYSQSFYAEPGRQYRVYIPEFDWSVDERQNIHLQPVPLPIEFWGVDDHELNVRISAFERDVDSFVVANRIYFDPKYKPNRRYFDTLCTFIQKRYNVDAEGDFASRYAAYTLAQMRYDMHFVGSSKAIGQYIEGKPIRYYDEQYMRLFFTLYADILSHGTRRIPQERIAYWIANHDLPTLIDSAGLDPALRNEQVRELAVLQALRECYYDANYNSNDVVAMVKQLRAATRFAEHRVLADNLLASMQKSSAGNELPKIILPDVDHKLVDLDTMRGKWLYIAFVRTGEPACQAELETMAYFRDSVYKYGGNVEFITICCDREFQKMYHTLRNSRRGARYNWLWLHFDGQYSLLEKYQVVSFPTFVLLNPEGQKVYDLTPAPASGFLLNAPWIKKADADANNNIHYNEDRVR